MEQIQNGKCWIRNAAVWSACGLLLLSSAALLLYVWFGHDVVRALYSSHSPLVKNWLMQGKAITPVEDYLDTADTMVYLALVRALALALILFSLRKPVWLLSTCASVLVLSFVLFCLAERFPSVVDLFQLWKLRYYAQRERFIADPYLGVRQKPLVHKIYPGGESIYSPLYDMEITPPTRVEWITDEDGFRNDAITGKTAGVVVMGDGLIISGLNGSDTFTNRLERHLTGLTIRNFGEDGQGPVEYLKVYKRYAIKTHPKYALLGFNEGNDLGDVRHYLNSQTQEHHIFPALEPLPLWHKYTIVATQAVEYVQERVWNFACVVLRYSDSRHGYGIPIHRDMALLKLPTGRTSRILFIDKLIPQSVAEIAETPEWIQLKTILVEFQNLSRANNIIPMIMYIPSSTHIYAQYSTAQSGRNWLKIRDQQIAAKANLENAFLNVCRELAIKCIDLSPVFELAAKDGKMLYNALNTHWNSEAVELAATYVADVLNSTAMTRPDDKLNNHRRRRDSAHGSHVHM